MNEFQKQLELVLQLPGNASAFDPEYVEPFPASPLKGKRIVFLGSSVTYGVNDISFVDYLARKDGVIAEKYAVSGTTLVDEISDFALSVFGNGDSYVQRLIRQTHSLDACDCFVCQLSTNDATGKKPLGEILLSKNPEDYDRKTVAGALEFLIAYCRTHSQCPVVFYTNCYFDSPEYAEMVQMLYALQKKWGIELIDLYSDRNFNSLSSEQRQLYMIDRIHPTKAGYLEWWLPVFEKRLAGIIRA